MSPRDATSMQSDWSWSEFVSIHDIGPPKLVRGSFDQLVKMVSNPRVFAGKELQPLLKLATFGPTRSGRQSYRHDDNVTAITGVEGDYDAGEISVSEAIKRLERWGVKAVVFTTAQHEPDKPRWRVLAPCSKELPPQERCQLVARLNGALGGVLANESFTLSQAFYFGRITNSPYEWDQTFSGQDGEFIDLIEDLDKVACGRSGALRTECARAENRHTPRVDATTFQEKVRDLGRKLRTGDCRRDMLRSFIGSKSKQGHTADEIIEEVRELASLYFDADDPIDWENIRRIITTFTENDEKQRGSGEPSHEHERASAERKQGMPRDAILIPLDESEPVRPVPTLIREFLPLDGMGMLWAEPGSFKTFVALDMGLSVASGLPWFGRPVMKGRVWYLAGEGQEGLKLRVSAWRALHQYKGPVDFHHSQRAVTLDDEASPGLSALESLVETDEPPRFVIVDTLARAMTGDESSARDAGRFVTAVDALMAKIRGAGQPCCVLLVHHSRKDGEIYRGSSALRGAADFEFEMRRTGGHSCVLRCHKVKEGKIPPEVYLNGRVIDLGLEVDNHNERVELSSLAFELSFAPTDETLTEEALSILPEVRKVLREEFPKPKGASKKALAIALRKRGCHLNDRTFVSKLEVLANHGHLHISRGRSGQQWHVTDASIASQGCADSSSQEPGGGSL